MNRVNAIGSHPMWVRGLKREKNYNNIVTDVAPYVGAWIETTMNERLIQSLFVAPYVGAWIETT